MFGCDGALGALGVRKNAPVSMWPLAAQPDVAAHDFHNHFSDRASGFSSL
jgi:hypothetical protein